MSKIEKLIERFCPYGVEYKTIDEVFIQLNGMAGAKHKWADTGNCQFIDYMNAYKNITIDVTELNWATVKNLKQTTLKKGDVLFTAASETPDECALASEIEDEISDYIFMDDHLFGLRIKREYEEDIAQGFLKYWFRSSSFRKSVNKTVRGVTRFYISKTDFMKLRIPVPPLEVQREIVRVLDNFTLLTAELTAELQLRRKQYEYYRNNILTFNTDIKYRTMGELFPFIRNGFVGTVTPYFTDAKHGVRYLEGTNIHNGVISDNEILYVTKQFHQDHIKNELKSDDILMVQSGHIGECSVVGEKYAGANCHALIIMSNGGECNSKYVCYYFHTYQGLRSLKPAITGGTVKHVLATKIKDIKIPVPPKEVQDRIVYTLDNFETVCNSLSIGLPAEIEARKKQYEYYRDALLTFVETGETIARQTDRQTDRQNLIKLFQYVFGYAPVLLKDIAMYRSDRISAKDVDGDSYVGVDNLLPNKAGIKKSEYVPTEGRLIKYDAEDILIGNIRPYLKKIWISDGLGGTNGDVLAIGVIDKSSVCTKYLYHVLASDNFFAYDNQHSKGAKMPRGDKQAVMNYELTLPCYAEQKRISKLLDRFDIFCNDITNGLPAEIEARQKQYEYYRDKLLTFKEFKSNEPV